MLKNKGERHVRHELTRGSMSELILRKMALEKNCQTFKLLRRLYLKRTLVREMALRRYVPDKPRLYA